MTAQDMTQPETAARDIGPIDYLAVEFPEARMRGEGLAALLDLGRPRHHSAPRRQGRSREVDGTFTAAAITDLDGDGTLDLAIFEGVESGLIDDEDLRQAADLIEPGKVELCSCMRTPEGFHSSTP